MFDGEIPPLCPRIHFWALVRISRSVPQLPPRTGWTEVTGQIAGKIEPILVRATSLVKGISQNTVHLSRDPPFFCLLSPL